LFSAKFLEGTKSGHSVPGEVIHTEHFVH